MIVWVYLFLGFLAAASSYMSISRRINEELGGLFSVFCWAVWAQYSFDVSVQDGGVTFTESYLPLALLGMGAAGIMLYFFIKAITGALNPREETRFAAREDL